MKRTYLSLSFKKILFSCIATFSLLVITACGNQNAKKNNQPRMLVDQNVQNNQLRNSQFPQNSQLQNNQFRGNALNNNKGILQTNPNSTNRLNSPSTQGQQFPQNSIDNSNPNQQTAPTPPAQATDGFWQGGVFNVQCEVTDNSGQAASRVAVGALDGNGSRMRTHSFDPSPTFQVDSKSFIRAEIKTDIWEKESQKIPRFLTLKVSQLKLEKFYPSLLPDETEDDDLTDTGDTPIYKSKERKDSRFDLIGPVWTASKLSFNLRNEWTHPISLAAQTGGSAFQGQVTCRKVSGPIAMDTQPQALSDQMLNFTGMDIPQDDPRVSDGFYTPACYRSALFIGGQFMRLSAKIRGQAAGEDAQLAKVLDAARINRCYYETVFKGGRDGILEPENSRTVARRFMLYPAGSGSSPVIGGSGGSGQQRSFSVLTDIGHTIQQSNFNFLYFFNFRILRSSYRPSVIKCFSYKQEGDETQKVTLQEAQNSFGAALSTF